MWDPNSTRFYAAWISCDAHFKIEGQADTEQHTLRSLRPFGKPFGQLTVREKVKRNPFVLSSKILIIFL